jgi:hypothetical protein
MSKALEREPWQGLPKAVVPLIEPELPGLRDEILEVIAAEVPEYARPLRGRFGRGIRLGVAEALSQFVRLIANPTGGRAQSREVYRALGRGEYRQGRSLDSLQAAYRVGARVAWRRLSGVGLKAGAEPKVVAALADAIFAYIDELAADSVEGYAEAQQAAAGERDRLRRHLVTVLLSEAPDPDDLQQAAAGAGWELPRTLAVLACEPEDLEPIARRIPDALSVVVEDVGCTVVPDPDGPGRRVEVERACDGRAAALGTTQPVDGAVRSWARARSGLAAIHQGILTRELCFVDEHLAEIALVDAREPLGELAERRLAPLADLTPNARDRMRATLRAYLDHCGSAPVMAGALHVHPQTVRYRLKQLRELFGESLDDPDGRFELAVALRAERA